MFYTALISSNHYTNDGNNEKWLSIDICPNYVFSTNLGAPVTGDPHGSQRVTDVDKNFYTLKVKNYNIDLH